MSLIAKTDNPTLDSTEEQVVNEPKHILRLLQRLTKKRVYLTIQFPGITGKYTTNFLLIDQKTHQIHWDQLTPTEGHRYIQIGMSIMIHASYEGMSIDIPLVVNSIKQDNKGPFYTSYFPTYIHYFHRREFYRVNTPATMNKPSIQLSNHSSNASGELMDISLGGFRMMVNKPYQGMIKKGNTMEAKITMLTHTLSLSIQICELKNICSKSIMIRAKFHTPCQQNLRLIEQITANFQIEHLKNKHLS